MSTFGTLKLQWKKVYIVVMFFEPFMKWRLHFMGLMKLVAQYTNNQYIMVMTNYTIKRVNAEPL
jgi:hypothetical protein